MGVCEWRDENCDRERREKFSLQFGNECANLMIILMGR